MNGLCRPDIVLAALGLRIVLALSEAATRALVQRDIERWSKLVRELDLKPE